jgi:glycosyltransferase involved in cell wall biosynthesis
MDARFTITDGKSRRQVSLAAYLDAALEERATASSYDWIKSLRHLRVNGQPFRQRFMFRDDSLWWFAELYLHKQQVILEIFRTVLALEALFERERPHELEFVRGDQIARGLAPQLAATRNVRYRGPKGYGRSAFLRLVAMDARAVSLHAAALASRFRARVPPRHGPRSAVAFVHRAFWRSDAGEAAEPARVSGESYIGPVLTALEERLDRGTLAYVSVGPASNFRARRWWHPLRSGAPTAFAIEAYAPLSKLRASRRVWRERHRMRRTLWQSADLRQHSIIGRCDCWPIIREELAGVALLQWPWSARAMDEAAAALDALQPDVAITYAEAGAWGRAVMLECRRRGIPSVGLQHGFIYRHWLNYLHESDEMTGDAAHEADRGFPRPTLTLLFDEYAAQHLITRGRYPSHALTVTGSPRLDALASDATRLTPLEIDEARRMAGAGSRTLVLVTTKHREARGVLATLLDAAALLAGVHLAIKPHPAETPAVYADLVAGRSGVTVLPASAPLAALLRACRAVVTVNSTVALDAAVLGVPTLVIGLPNNLSPFVEAGIMSGVTGTSTGETARALDRILTDEEFRRELARAQRAFLARFSIAADGRAAERAAEAIVQLARSPRPDTHAVS